MVTTVSPSVRAHHESDKRRKHTLEKSKVAHLTRQLQLRLQYAKLKVDHGWQRQNLNEVENLYFHHSHLRVPKFQLQLMQPSALLGDAVAAELNTEPRGAQTNLIQTDSNGAVQAGFVPLSPNHHPVNVAADLPSTQQHHEGADGACKLPSSPSNQHQSENFSNFLQSLSNSCKKPVSTQATKSPLHPRTSSVSSSFTSNNNTPKTPNTSTASSHLFPSSSSSTALTYDSFWSNHNSSRPFRSSFLSLLSSTDPDVNKVAAQALLSELSGKNITSHLNNNLSDFMTSVLRPPTDATPTLTPMARRNLPTIAEASEGG